MQTKAFSGSICKLDQIFIGHIVSIMDQECAPVIMQIVLIALVGLCFGQAACGVLCVVQVAPVQEGHGGVGQDIEEDYENTAWISVY